MNNEFITKDIINHLIQVMNVAVKFSIHNDSHVSVAWAYTVNSN